MPLDFKQSSFQGGMNQRFDATKIAQLGDSYYLGVNVRNRDDTLEPINKPKDISSKLLEGGNLQGIFGAGNLILIFRDGNAFVWNVEDNVSGFKQILTAGLDKNVPYIYAEFVPGSTLGYARLRVPITNLSGAQVDTSNVTFDLDRNIPYNSSAQGVIYQDGLNQGRFILDDGTTSATNKWKDWNLNKREYVPVMKQMIWTSGILFGISPNGKEIYRSVTGRPLDFMIPINEDGDKVGDELSGGAPSVAHRVDYEAITAIKAAPAQDTIIVTTKNKTFLVSLDFDNLIFDEPSFKTFPVASTGAINQYCFADLNGDTGIINDRGIHSFNAAAQMKQESSNDSVSGIIGKLFSINNREYVTQDYPCAFDYGADYALFAVNTIYGRGVLVYDKISQKFISLDIYEGIAQIKQFASVVVNNVRRLFFITTDNKFYEAFAGDKVETAGLLIGEWCSNDPKIEQRPTYLNLVFSDVEETGSVTITPFVDRVKRNSKSEVIKQNITTPVLPISKPFNLLDQTSSVPIVFNLDGTINAGWKFGVYIEWNIKAKLTHVSLSGETEITNISERSKSRRLSSIQSKT